MPHSRLVAPTASGSRLIHPPLLSWPLLAEHSRALDDNGRDVAGRPLGELRVMARGEVIRGAQSYLAEIGEPIDSAAADSLLFVTGHQPELFHPGVWLKNWVAERAARAAGGVAVHVLMDNDVLRASAIRVPVGKDGHFLIGHVPFDRWDAELPHEDRDVLDEKVFEQFADRISSTMAPLGLEPVHRDYWRRVLAAPTTMNLGERLASGRRGLQREWGLRQREVPFSRLCRGESFLRLLADMLARSAVVQREYNDALSEYRARYHLRSRNHPATDLTMDAEWLEVPYWMWTKDAPVRKPLFVRVSEDVAELRAGSRRIEIPVDPDRLAESLFEGLRRADHDVRIRPRALMATLFLRLLASDWFIHGIGGAKYDEVTDRLIGRLYGVEPPPFGVATGTLTLTHGQDDGARELSSEVRRHARDMYWNPDRYLDGSLRDRSPLAELIEEKIEWAHTESQGKEERLERFFALRRINERLRPHVEVQRQRALARAEALAAEERSRSILYSREYAFCLHSANSLRAFLDTAGDSVSD